VQPLACRSCGNQVLVKKNSLEHTSVQWADSTPCVEFALVPDINQRARVPGCAQLRESIDDAVRGGRIEVPAP